LLKSEGRKRRRKEREETSEGKHARRERLERGGIIGERRRSRRKEG
jgi:hypothetical protein